MNSFFSHLRSALLCVFLLTCPAAQAKEEYVLTTDAEFCRSLLYEPLTAQERERALEDIRQDAVLQREVERIYAQYLRLNQEAGGHAPVIVTPEERSRRTEPTFFNTPDFSLF